MCIQCSYSFLTSIKKIIFPLTFLSFYLYQLNLNIGLDYFYFGLIHFLVFKIYHFPTLVPKGFFAQIRT